MSGYAEISKDLSAAAVAIEKPIPSLLAVSKKQPIEKVLEVYREGQRDFGENYAQELDDKAKKMPPDCCWHFIGPIQSNKIKIIAKHASWVHSLSSVKHATILERELEKLNKKINALIQVNVDDESSKHGIRDNKDFMELAKILKRSNLIMLRGFMMLPKLNKSKEELSNLGLRINEYKKILYEIGCTDCVISLGTSSDYQEAIKLGSTIIRVGEKIFGNRF